MFKLLKHPAALASLAIGLSLAGANVAFAATSDTQNVTFSVAKALAVSSGGNVTISSSIDPSSGSPTGTGSSSVNLKSNDASGFQVTASTTAANVTEAGASCSGTNQASVGIMTVAAGAVSGGTGGAGTPASAVTLSTSAQNLYSTVPTAVGGSLSATTSYVVTPGYTTPANSANCSYTIPVTLAVVAQ